MAATLFDYNGVLVDDEAVHLAAFRDVLSPLGIRLSEEEYWEKYLGFDDREAFAEVLRSHALDASPERVSRLVEEKKPRYLERAKSGLRAFDGAAELLRARARLGPVVIVSGALRDEIELGLDVLGVRGDVHGIVSAEDTARSKPDPEGYRLGVEQLRSLGHTEPVHGIVVFEDSLDGIRAAKAIDLYCVAVAHSYAVERLRQVGADVVVPRIAEVAELLPVLVSG